MKHLFIAALVAASGAQAVAAEVGVSVGIAQPGFYGRIDIGRFPQPQVIYAEPRVIVTPRAGVPVPRPIYLHVPPGHARDWAKHCRKYNACAQPVFFVQERWYQDVYAPRYRDEYAPRPGDRRDHRGPHDDRRGRGKDHHPDDRGGHPGKSHGNGRGRRDD